MTVNAIYAVYLVHLVTRVDGVPYYEYLKYGCKYDMISQHLIVKKYSCFANYSLDLFTFDK